MYCSNGVALYSRQWWKFKVRFTAKLYVLLYCCWEKKSGQLSLHKVERDDSWIVIITKGKLKKSTRRFLIEFVKRLPLFQSLPWPQARAKLIARFPVVFAWLSHPFLSLFRAKLSNKNQIFEARCSEPRKLRPENKNLQTFYRTNFLSNAKCEVGLRQQYSQREVALRISLIFFALPHTTNSLYTTTRLKRFISLSFPLHLLLLRFSQPLKVYAHNKNQNTARTPIRAAKAFSLRRLVWECCENSDACLPRKLGNFEKCNRSFGMRKVHSSIHSRSMYNKREKSIDGRISVPSIFPISFRLIFMNFIYNSYSHLTFMRTFLSIRQRTAEFQ